MKTLTKIALIALLWITTINSGMLGSIDTDLRLQMAHAWWTGTEEVSIPSDYKLKVRGDIVAGVVGVDGKRYIAYEPGQSLLMLPGDWLGTQLHRWFPILPERDWRMLAVNFFIFIPLNVAAVVSCFWLLRVFDFNERIAGLTSIAWLLGTTVLHYAQVHQHNNQILLFVILGYASALSYVLRDRPRFALLSGFVLGGTVLIRITSVVHAFTVLLFLVGCIAYQSRDRLKIFRGIGLWMVGFIPLALLGRILDYLRYGSFLATGKGIEKQQLATDPLWAGLPDLPANYPLINEPHVGILGPLLSPAKSLFIYDPFLLPCILLGILFWKRFSPYVQWYLITGFFNLGLHLLAYSRFFFWHGDSAWGARYHVTSVHLLLIPLLALFIQLLLSAKGWVYWLMRGIVAFAIAAQIASVTLHMNLEIYQSQLGVPGTRFDFRLGQRMVNIGCLVNHSFSRLCLDRNPDKKSHLEKWNTVKFIPFAFSRKASNNPVLGKFLPLTFLVWILLTFSAIIATKKFVFMS